MNLTGTPERIFATVQDLYPGAEPAVQRARQLTAGHSMKGTVYDYQAAVLYALCIPYDRQDANILEIGTYYGFTAIVMAQAAPRATILTLNPLEWEVNAAARALVGFDNIQQVQITSQELLENYQGPDFDFIFVDGDHKRIKEDLQWWCHLAIGGTILFHDYTPFGAPKHCPPVVRGLNAFTAMLGRYADHVIIDDQQAGMLGWVKSAADKPCGLEEWANG